MNIEFKSDKNELSKLGILDTYIKRKIKYYFLKDFKKIKSDQQTKIIKDWKDRHSIKTNKDFDNWLKFYEINFEEWIELINFDYKWASWCLNQFKEKLFSYYQQKKDEFDYYTFSKITVKKKDLADELYLRIKEKESTFEEIALKFSEGNEKLFRGSIGPVLFKNIEDSISKILKVGDENQIWQPKFIDSEWTILRLDKKSHADFNHKLKIKLALELGDEFLEEKFYEIQRKNTT